MPAYLPPFVETALTGLDFSLRADELPPGSLTDATSVFADRGSASVRPGYRAVWASALGLTPYEGVIYIDPTGQAWLVFAAGSTTTGRVYKWKIGDAAPTQIFTSTNFNAQTVQFTHLGDWLWVTGAIDGGLRRTNCQTSSNIEQGPTAWVTAKPTAPTPSLTNSTLVNFGTAATWASDHFTGPSPDAHITGDDLDMQSVSTSGITAPGILDSGVNGWRVAEGTIEAHTGVDGGSPGDKYVLMDEPGSAFITNPGHEYTNPTKVNGNATGQSARKAVHYALPFKYKSGVGAADSLLITLIACDALGDEIARDTQTFTSPLAATVLTGTTYHSFASILSDDAISLLKIRVEAGPTNTSGGSGPYIAFLDPTAYEPPVVFTLATGEVRVSYTLSSAGANAPQNVLLIGDNSLALPLAAASDWSAYSKVALPVNFLYPGTDALFAPVLRLRKTAAGVGVTTDTGILTTDATGTKYWSFDLSVLLASDRTGLNFLDLVFLNDVVMPAGSVYPGVFDFLGLGSLVLAGNLSVTDALNAAGPYHYKTREKKASDGLTSPASDATTPALAATDLTAQASIVLPAGTPINSNAAGPATQVELWREGGIFSDGMYRFIGVATLGSDSPPTTTKLWGYTSSTKTFTDNVPDGSLLDALILVDHEAPPASTGTLWAHHGRLMLATNTDVWLSQPLAGAAAGLYYNSVIDLSNPQYLLFGWRKTLTGNEGYSAGGVLKAVPLEDRTIILYGSGPFVLTGTGLPAYNLFGGQQPQPPFNLARASGVEQLGPLSARGVCLWNSRIWWVAADGLRSFSLSTGNQREENLAIERLVAPASLFAGDNWAGANGLLPLFTALDRLFLPHEESSTVQYTLVYDERAPGWAKWGKTPGGSGSAFYGGAVFTGPGQVNTLYAWDAAGMLYQIGGANWGDKATSGASAATVPFSIQSRDYRGQGTELVAQRISLTVRSSATMTLTIAVEGDDTALAWSQTFAVPGGAKPVDISLLKVHDRVRGRCLRWRVSGTTAGSFALERVELLATSGKVI